MFWEQKTINFKGRLFDISEPVVMGILNATPDSFYDGGNYLKLESAKNRIDRMLQEGASIIDVGGMSTRPGSRIVSPSEEMDRILPIIEWISTKYIDSIVSVDTVHSVVAEQAVKTGARMVNDISAGRIDDGLIDMVSSLKVPYILTHMQGLPKNMQKHPHYEDVTLEILDFFISRINEMMEKGIVDIIIDPGFGFGKSISHNYQILNNLHVFQMVERPILVGISRKSMITKVLGVEPQFALNGTTVLHMFALQKGAKILRTHDVQQAVECIQLWKKLKGSDKTASPDKHIE